MPYFKYFAYVNKVLCSEMFFPLYFNNVQNLDFGTFQVVDFWIRAFTVHDLETLT